MSFIILTGFSASSQDKVRNLYNPGADAMAEIDSAVGLAARTDKHVLIQVGGNWCKWCIRLHQFIESHSQLDSIIKADYVFIHVNYSKENKNPEAMKRLDYPNRFGFPVFVVLDQNGYRLHTQDTAFLEEGEGYNEKKIRRFLLGWTVEAVASDIYQ